LTAPLYALASVSTPATDLPFATTPDAARAARLAGSSADDGSHASGGDGVGSGEPGATGKMSLSSAVALRGLCEGMCPEREIAKRANENEVSRFERPKGWARGDVYKLPPPTPVDVLRKGMVKELKKSSADYKLDDPELVRPPAVLFRTMEYIEEHIMELDRLGPDRSVHRHLHPTRL